MEKQYSFSTIKGIIFDYGGTIDSNGKHWAEVLWDAYKDNKIPVTKTQFREAYIYAERYLATHPVIQSDFNFKDTLLAKTKLQINYLKEKGFLAVDNNFSQYPIVISNQCYTFVCLVLKKTIPILQALKREYPLVLVSNFYGNIEAVLKDFNLDSYFNAIIESSVVKIKKPNPAIFELGIKALNFDPEEIVVIGDSYEKDIIPSSKTGCKTIWLKGTGWDDKEIKADLANLIITDFEELKSVFRLS